MRSRLRETPRTRPAARKSVAYLQRAADAELPTAIYLLGVLAEGGVGVASDPAPALEPFKRAAEKGLPAAQAKYGAALMDGALCQQDLAEAETWLRRAAMAGEVEAAARVGDLNIRNGDRPPNYAEAADLVSPRGGGRPRAVARARWLRSI